MQKFQIPANFILFFSLPFYPIIKKNILINGHLALGLDKNVYQIFNPVLLKTDFLVSKMPIDEWLYNDRNFWVCREKNLDTYKYVHLYKKAEIKRTIVYYAGINLSPDEIIQYENYFFTIEEKFKQRKLNFNLLTYNCASVLNEIFYNKNWIKKGPLDFLPAVVYRKLLKKFKKINKKTVYGKIPDNMSNHFKTHKFCLGLFTIPCNKYLDKLIQ